ncbi:MAG: HAD family hydrolase [Lachnospiraceae bacterium]|nr:HAD family hydrolase [Lachnospiraceae bacterium]
MKVDGIIFDMDGTLWDSAANVAASWNAVLDKLGEVKARFTEADIKSVMGQTMDSIAARFFTEVSPKRQMEIMMECGEYENEYLSFHGGVLYPELEETLKKLAKNHKLCIVSNCQSGYIEAFLQYYGFEDYFTDILCWGDNELPKGDNIKLMIERNNLKAPVYVGDIQGDCDSTYYAGAKFIHAAYGFGHVDRCDARIEKFSDLLEVIE